MERVIEVNASSAGTTKFMLIELSKMSSIYSFCKDSCQGRMSSYLPNSAINGNLAGTEILSSTSTITKTTILLLYLHMNSKLSSRALISYAYPAVFLYFN